MARTAEFDRNEVLNNAMSTFWENGYSQTSIPDLVKATKLQPGSLYSAFKSKEGLLLETIERFHSTGMNKIKDCLTGEESHLDGIRQFLKEVVGEVLSDDKRRGCFIINTFLEFSSDKVEVQNSLKQCMEAVENAILESLKYAQDSGELPLNKDPVILAKFIMVNIWGLRVLGKTRPDKAQTNLIYDQLISCLK